MLPTVPEPPVQQLPQPQMLQPNRFNTQALQQGVGAGIGGGFVPPTQQPPPYGGSGEGVPQQVEKVEPALPVEKAPIPDEHRQIQNVFDELRNKCVCAAGNQVSLVFGFVLFYFVECFFLF